MLRYIGYPDEFIDSSCTYRLAVMSMDTLETFDIFQPSFVSWFPQLRDRFGLEFTAEARKEVKSRMNIV